MLFQTVFLYIKTFIFGNHAPHTNESYRAKILIIVNTIIIIPDFFLK